MCGILGVATRKEITDTSWIKKGLIELNHRGPDASGNWLSPDKKVGLCHTRLSIIDLDKKANQPMIFADGTYCVVFNGEIYNYQKLKRQLYSYGRRFKTVSDTEVLLQAYVHWGTDCVNHFIGMFSFAIYDDRQKIVFFARDRVGEKPFFYYYDEDSVYFASELKALLKNPKIPRHFNFESLDCFLTVGHVPDHLCILEGFNKLPAGHFMIFHTNSGKLQLSKYWNVPKFDKTKHLSENCLLNELEFLLEDAVKKQLTSDVPVGVLLSGGFDSSLVTAFAARSTVKVKTFTIRIPGNEALDETKHAKLVANFFGSDHIELEAKEPNTDLLLEVARYVDEPMADSSIIPTYLLSKLVKEHCSVALGGDGGDELFGGYHHYNRLLRMEKDFGSMPFALRKIISSLGKEILPIGFRGRNFLSELGTDFSRSLPLINQLFDHTNRLRLVPALENKNKRAEEIILGEIQPCVDLLYRATRQDLKNYLTEDILVKIDRASMANSLEMRAPLLDHRIIEFAFSKVPSSLKANTSQRKILLKKLAEKILPREFDKNRKQGFSIPLSDWLREGKSRAFFNDVLSDSSCMFNRSVTERLLQSIDKGRTNSERLFALLMMELWRRQYDVRL